MNDQNLRHHKGVKPRGSKYPLQLRIGKEVSKIQQSEKKKNAFSKVQDKTFLNHGNIYTPI